MFRRLEAPQSLRDSSPKWEQAHLQALWSARKLYRTAKGSPLWESWQARQGLTERAGQLPAAHFKSLIRLPKPCGF